MPLNLSFVGLTVADMPASLAFYRRLGLQIPATADQEPHVEFTAPGGVLVCWDTAEVIRSFDPGYTPASGGRFALAFALDSPAEVNAKYQEMVDAGNPGHLPPWDAFWGQRYAVLLDPDGTTVDLFAPLG